MAKQVVFTGTVANDGTGDGLREAFTKVNANFTEIYIIANAAFERANVELDVAANNWTNTVFGYANTSIAAANAWANTVGVSANSYADDVGAASNTYADDVGVSANTYADEVGAASNTYAYDIGIASNNYIIEVGAASNTWANTVGAAANTYADDVGVSANTYADEVGAASNTWANTVGAAANSYADDVGFAANTYADEVGAAANSYADDVGFAANTYADGKLANTTVTLDGDLTVSGNVIPSTNDTFDLGTSDIRWKNIYTNDLNLKNGIGDYTIVEGENDLFVYNNKQGKVYKFALIEVDPSEAPKKA